jgi:hypothetical protein
VDLAMLPSLAGDKQVSRSGVLQPFVYLVISVLAAISGLVKLAAPTWLLILMSSVLVVLLLSMLGIVFVMIKRGHYYALLSERYNLGALALGSQTFGSSENGSFQPSQSMMPSLPFEKAAGLTVQPAPGHEPSKPVALNFAAPSKPAALTPNKFAPTTNKPEGG